MAHDKSYIHNHRLIGPYVYDTYFSLLDQHAEKTPDREAYVFYEGNKKTSLTFEEVSEKSFKLASILLSTYPSLQKGDRIALVASNSPLFVITEIAILRLGGTVVFPPVGITGGQDLIHAMRIACCHGIICDHDYVEEDTVSLLHEYIPELKFAICFGADSEEEQTAITNFSSITSSGRPDMDDAKNVRERQEVADPDDPAIVFFTSGTTGEPKAVVYSQFSLINNMLLGTKVALFLSSRDVIFANNPFTHHATQIMGVGYPCCVGTKAVITDTKETVVKANTKILCEIIAKEKCTAGLLFGHILHDIIHYADIGKMDFSNFRMAITSGQRLHEDQAAAVKVILPNVALLNLYGSTELSMTAGASPRAPIPSNGYIGHVFPGVEIKLVDDDGVCVPVGMQGELCGRGYYVSMGNMVDGKIQKMSDEQGWVHSGDYAVMNKEGHIKIEGRKSDIIKRAAIKIFPAQVEKVLLQHECINQVQVIGVPDPRLHEDLCACIIKENDELTEELLEEWCKSVFQPGTTGLSMAPTYFLFLDDYPRTGSGKISKVQLKEMAKKHVEELRGVLS